MKDERILQQIYKVRNEIALWMYLALVVSMLVKELILNLPVSDCLLELILMIAVPVYQFIRLQMLGVGVALNSKKRRVRIFSTLVGIVVYAAIYVFLMIRHGQHVDAEGVVLSIAIFAAAFCLVNYVARWIAERRNRQLADQYDDEDDNEAK